MKTTAAAAPTTARNSCRKPDLDQLCIRLRSLEIREKAVSQKTDASEKWMQETLTVHLERDTRLAAYWHDQLFAEATQQLRRF